jgi:hypothetical protein
MNATNDLRQLIVAEIKRLAAMDGGRPPGRDAFARKTGIKMSQWSGVVWPRWGDALKEAGFSPNEWQFRYDPGVLFTKLAEAIRHFGRIPSEAELRIYKRTVDEDFPSHSTFGLNFGPKAEMLLKLKEWISGQTEWHDVEQLLPERPVSQKSQSAKVAKTDGSVYLICSGQHYKIGRSDQLERRVKEIRIALPEAATLEHVIATDDPSGIESYWHRRFASRRANGEWFALTPQDVLAFKRRKFQ